MKNVRICSFVTLLLLSIILSGCKSKIDETVEQVKTMPEICLNEYKGGLYDLSQQPPLKKTVITFFTPDCDHCEAEIDSICNHAADFKDVRWIMITDYFYEDLLDFFLANHKLSELENSVILIEKRHQYKELFQVLTTPSTFIYNSNNKLIHYSRRAVDINNLLSWLK